MLPDDLIIRRYQLCKWVPCQIEHLLLTKLLLFLGQWFSNLSMYWNHPEGLLQNRWRIHPQSFWFSRSWDGSWGFAFLISSHVVRMQPCKDHAFKSAGLGRLSYLWDWVQWSLHEPPSPLFITLLGLSLWYLVADWLIPLQEQMHAWFAMVCSRTGDKTWLSETSSWLITLHWMTSD